MRMRSALGDIARAKGMSQIARETGLGRESLYKALSPDGNPEFSTVLKVAHWAFVSAQRPMLNRKFIRRRHDSAT
jgi:probable addiction module antidote protein